SAKRKRTGIGGLSWWPRTRWGSLFLIHLFSLLDVVPLIRLRFRLRCSPHCPPANERSSPESVREGQCRRQRSPCRQPNQHSPRPFTKAEGKLIRKVAQLAFESGKK